MPGVNLRDAHGRYISKKVLKFDWGIPSYQYDEYLIRRYNLTREDVNRNPHLHLMRFSPLGEDSWQNLIHEMGDEMNDENPLNLFYGYYEQIKINTSYTFRELNTPSMCTIFCPHDTNYCVKCNISLHHMENNGFNRCIHYVHIYCDTCFDKLETFEKSLIKQCDIKDKKYHFPKTYIYLFTGDNDSD